MIKIIFFIAVCTIILFAQGEGENLKDYNGSVSYKYNQYSKGYDYAQKYSKQEEAAVKQKCEAVAAYLKKNLLVAKPKGVELFLTSLISEEAPFSKWTKGLVYELQVLAYPWFVKKGKPAWKCAECATGFVLHFNRPDLIFNGTSIEGLSNICDENGILMGVEPVKIGEQNGCIAYENNTIVIAKGKPVFIPVSVREYDEALIRYYEKRKKEYPDEIFSIDILINRIKEEIASFPDEDLKKQAFIGANMGGSPCGGESEYAKRIVKMNPDYFDKSKPRTAAQLMIIQSGSIGVIGEGSFYAEYEYASFQSMKIIEILKSIDFNDLKQFFD
jgi:hypothetical protein